MVHGTVVQNLVLIAAAIFSCVFPFFRLPLFCSLTKKFLIKIFVTSGVSLLLSNLILFTSHSITILVDLKNLLIGFHFLIFIAYISSIVLVANFFSLIFIVMPSVFLYLIFCWITGKLQDEEAS